MSTQRVWKGESVAQRRADRRSRLLTAGTRLLGSGGGSAVTVRAVCREAGLTERYFYEAFTDRDELVVTVYDRVAAQTREVVARAVADEPGDLEGRARATVEALVDFLAEDPHRARILVAEALVDPVLTREGIRVAPELFGLLVDEVLPAPTAAARDRTLLATSLAGGIGATILAWCAGELDIGRDRMVEHAVTLISTMVRGSAAGEHP